MQVMVDMIFLPEVGMNIRLLFERFIALGACLLFAVFCSGCVEEDGDVETSTSDTRTPPDPEDTTQPENASDGSGEERYSADNAQPGCGSDQDCRGEDTVNFPETARCRPDPINMVQMCTDCHTDEECPDGLVCQNYQRCVEP